MIGARQSTDRDLPARLVDRFDVDVEIGAKNLALATLQGDAIEAGQRIRRQTAAPPSDHVTIVVVMRRLDQNKPEKPVGFDPRRKFCAPKLGARRFGYFCLHNPAFCVSRSTHARAQAWSAAGIGPSSD